MVDSYTVFVAMYYALDAAWDDGVKTDELRSYLSEINPFIWKGECSADPANYIKFKDAYENELGEGASSQEAYDFVSGYLKQIRPEFSGLFCSTVNEIEWENVLPEIESQLNDNHKDPDVSTESLMRLNRLGRSKSM